MNCQACVRELQIIRHYLKFLWFLVATPLCSSYFSKLPAAVSTLLTSWVRRLEMLGFVVLSVAAFVRMSVTA